MKKLILILFTVVFIFLSAFSAFAVDANSVAFKTENISCSKGRLFTVDVKANSPEKLSSVTFKFTYDRKLIEYRNVSTDSESVVSAYDNGNTLNVSYLCTYGKNVSENSTIFTLQFKALDNGECDLSYTAYNCVSPSINDIETSECIGSTVTISNSGNEISSTSKAEHSKGTSQDAIVNNESMSQSTADEAIELNSKLQDNTTFMLLVGVLCGLAVGVLCFILYLCVVKRKNKAKKEKESH